MSNDYAYDAANRLISRTRGGRTVGYTYSSNETLYAREYAAARAVFRTRLTAVAAEDIIIIDQGGSKLNLTPRYARAPRGQRAVGYVPRNTH